MISDTPLTAAPAEDVNTIPESRVYAACVLLAMLPDTKAVPKDRRGIHGEYRIRSIGRLVVSYDTYNRRMVVTDGERIVLDHVPDTIWNGGSPHFRRGDWVGQIMAAARAAEVAA